MLTSLNDHSSFYFDYLDVSFSSDFFFAFIYCSTSSSRSFWIAESERIIDIAIDKQLKVKYTPVCPHLMDIVNAWRRSTSFFVFFNSFSVLLFFPSYLFISRSLSPFASFAVFHLFSLFFLAYPFHCYLCVCYRLLPFISNS